MRRVISLLFLACGVAAAATTADATRLRRYTVVNLPIELLSLPSILTEQSIVDVCMACEVFIDSKLSPQANVTKVHVAMGKQTLKRSDGPGPLVLNLNILIEHFVSDDNMEPMSFDTQVTTLFTHQWADLISFLRLLDSAADTERFESVYRLEVPKAESRVTPEESIPISVYIILGVSIIFLLTTTVPLVCLFRRKSRKQEMQKSQSAKDKQAERSSELKSGHENDPTDSTGNASPREPSNEDGVLATSEAETLHTRNVGSDSNFPSFYIPISLKPPASVSTMSGTISMHQSSLNAQYEDLISRGQHGQESDEDINSNGGEDLGDMPDVASQPSQVLKGESDLSIDIINSTDSDDDHHADEEFGSTATPQVGAVTTQASI